MAEKGLALALGSVGLLAAAAALRRGSRARAPILIGYHCSRYEVEQPFWGSIGADYAGRFQELFAALPYPLLDRLQERADREGLGDLRFWSTRGDPSDDERAEEVTRLLEAEQIRWVWVAELPLSDTGSRKGASFRSSYGDWCYQVLISPDQVLGWFQDHATGGGGVGAFAVLYHERGGDGPIFQPVDPAKLDPERHLIYFPPDDLG